MCLFSPRLLFQKNLQSLLYLVVRQVTNSVLTMPDQNPKPDKTKPKPNPPPNPRPNPLPNPRPRPPYHPDSQQIQFPDQLRIPVSGGQSALVWLGVSAAASIFNIASHWQTNQQNQREDKRYQAEVREFHRREERRRALLLELYGLFY